MENNVQQNAYFVRNKWPILSLNPYTTISLLFWLHGFKLLYHCPAFLSVSTSSVQGSSGDLSNIILWFYFRFKLQTHRVLYHTLSSSSHSYHYPILILTLLSSSHSYFIIQFSSLFFILPHFDQHFQHMNDMIPPNKGRKAS